jgi:hypothetical protein
MNAAELVKKAAENGISLRLDGEKLKFTATNKPPEYLLAELQIHKAEIIEYLQSVERFLATVQTIWPEARLLTDAEQAEDKQFREQITLVREPDTKALK